MLYLLPIELLQSIFVLSPESLPALCLTSRRLNTLCVPLLYRDICISHSPNLVMLCQTLASDPYAAHSVKRLTINSLNLHMSPLKAFESIITQGLQALKRLIALDIDDSVNLDNCLHDCTFPHLESFCIVHTPSPESNPIIYSFLTRHPTLRNLSIKRSIDTWPDSYFDLPKERINLPKLVTYSGSDAWLDVLLPNQRISEVGVLSWDRYDVGIPSDVAHVCNLLASSEGPMLAFGTFNEDWNYAFLLQLAEALPYIREFSYIRYSPDEFDMETPDDDSGDYTNFLQGLLHLVMPRWKSLRSLHLRDVRPSLDVVWEDTEARVDEVVRLCDWTKVCPSLRICSFRSRRLWNRPNGGPDYDNTVWCPYFPEGDLDVMWTVLALVTGQHPRHAGHRLHPVFQRMIDDLRIAIPGCVKRADIEELRREVMLKYPGLLGNIQN